MFKKEPCVMCGQDCTSYVADMMDIFSTTYNKTYVCWRHIDTFLDDNQLSAVIEKSIPSPTGKWAGRPAFFSRAFLMDCTPTKLIAYSHRITNYKDKLLHENRCWYSSEEYQEEVSTILKRYFNGNSPQITKEQIMYIHSLLPNTLNVKEDIYSRYMVTSIKDLTGKEASEVIEILKKGGVL